LSIEGGESMYNRFDIVFACFNSEGKHIQKGKRPCVIVNHYGQHSTLLNVVPISSQVHKFRNGQHLLIGTDTGLKTESFVMFEQVCTIERENVLFTIGKLNKNYITEFKYLYGKICNIKIDRRVKNRPNDNYVIEIIDTIERIKSEIQRLKLNTNTNPNSVNLDTLKMELRINKRMLKQYLNHYNIVSNEDSYIKYILNKHKELFSANKVIIA
jgi:mRNA interferase MazF